ncbi:DMT family transporter [Paracidovorax anthurii]|uniref:EamA-like transporter family protein n=1 Tax=Paracidovorax anthurii TaxID=78229 RepID=A0A328YFN7_9BURK|nr:DMT family transporter [Paracidovorax anthurii]RAR72739.1 EamA-like transporter family protein [Paracidovorax anthurii]WCM94651.1 DMT family transporter [Acidovorax sp. NCPPB 2350]
MAAIAPLLFVVIWSTGFLVGRGVAAHADPFWFLAARFVGVAALLGLAALWARVAWPRGARRIALHLAAGALMSGLYVGPSWWAMSRGLPAGVMALIGALQPLFTALIAVTVLGGRLRAATWAGLALGFGGVAMVLWPRLQAAAGLDALPLPVLLAALGSILALTVGSMAQKSPLAAGDLRSAGAVQNLGAVAVLLCMALALGEPRWDGSPLLWGALAYSVLVLSIGGATLLIWLMRHGEATRTAALVLAVPPLSAVQAWALFGETLTGLQIAGFAVAIAGVALARR